MRLWLAVWQLPSLLWRTRQIEALRTKAGPRPAVVSARRFGSRSRCRSRRERELLRQLIAVVDRLWPRGPNCYRRVLMEVAMDSAAANDIVQLGFRSAGGPGSGHAWLGSGVVPDGKPLPYDAIVSI